MTTQAKTRWMVLRCCLAFAVVFSLSGVVSVALAEDFTTPGVQKKWRVLQYHGKAPKPRTSSSVLLSPEGGIGFVFPEGPDTAMLTTTSPTYEGSLIGDLSGKSVSAHVAVIRAYYPVFIYYNTGGGLPANVRFYFRTMDRTLGESAYWWSSPVYAELQDLNSQNTPVLTLLELAFDPSVWSDRDGHMGNADEWHLAAFAQAVSSVQEIGLSFGGGNNYAFGVGVNPGDGTFQLLDFSVTP